MFSVLFNALTQMTE